jgi:hypothetical protein
MRDTRSARKTDAMTPLLLSGVGLLAVGALG